MLAGCVVRLFPESLGRLAAEGQNFVTRPSWLATQIFPRLLSWAMLSMEDPEAMVARVDRVPGRIANMAVHQGEMAGLGVMPKAEDSIAKVRLRLLIRCSPEIWQQVETEATEVAAGIRATHALRVPEWAPVALAVSEAQPLVAHSG